MTPGEVWGVAKGSPTAAMFSSARPWGCHLSVPAGGLLQLCAVCAGVLERSQKVRTPPRGLPACRRMRPPVTHPALACPGRAEPEKGRLSSRL